MSTTASAPPSPAAATAQARALRSWSAPVRERLARAVADALGQWRTAWGLGEPPPLDGATRGRAPGVSSEAWPCASEAARIEPCAWRPVDEAAEGAWWAPLAPPLSSPRSVLRGEGALVAALCRPLFGDTGPGSEGWTATSQPGSELPLTLANETAHAAWEDCRRRLAAALGPSSSGGSQGRAAVGPADDVLRPWSGTLLLTLPWWGHAIALLLSGDRVAASITGADVTQSKGARAPGPLTPVWDALARRGARIQVQTSPFELELGALSALRIGDVLRTSHPLDRLLSVRLSSAETSSGATIYAGYLGRAGDARAVELIHSPPADLPGGEPVMLGSAL